MKFLNSLLGRHPEKITAKVEIYTWKTCPFCIRAKLLLWWKGVKYTEYKIDGDETARAAMAERSQGRRSVPQIFINNQHIGGCDDVYALDAQGQLDPLLQSA
jgi:glutaredoxin 3